MLQPVESFHEKLVWLLIDKVAIGALIGLAAFCASLLLERFKSALSFHTEVSKIRLQEIGKMWSIFGMVLVQLDAAMQGRRRIIQEEFDRVDEKTRNRIVASDRIPEAAESRIISQIKPSLELAMQELEKAWPRLEAARFWLGQRLYDKYVEHVNALARFSTELTNSLLSPRAFGAIAPRLEAIRTRLDIKEAEKAL